MIAQRNWGEPATVEIPPDAGKTVLFATAEGHSFMLTFRSDVFEPARIADCLLKAGWSMWVLEAELQERPIAGSMHYLVRLQGSFGNPRGTAAEAVAAVNAHQLRLKFSFVEDEKVH